MTPSMPGFVFNAYPETPPLHPHFLSPGAGPILTRIASLYPSFIPIQSISECSTRGTSRPVPRRFRRTRRFRRSGYTDNAGFSIIISHMDSDRLDAPGAVGARRGGGGGGEYFPPIGTAMDPSSSISSLSSHAASSPSRLNARDRLASTSVSPTTAALDGNGEDLVKSAQQLSLHDPLITTTTIRNGRTDRG